MKFPRNKNPREKFRRENSPRDEILNAQNAEWTKFERDIMPKGQNDQGTKRQNYQGTKFPRDKVTKIQGKMLPKNKFPKGQSSHQTKLQ